MDIYPYCTCNWENPTTSDEEAADACIYQPFRNTRNPGYDKMLFHQWRNCWNAKKMNQIHPDCEAYDGYVDDPSLHMGTVSMAFGQKRMSPTQQKCWYGYCTWSPRIPQD